MIKRDSLNLTKLFGKDRSQEDENLQHYFIKTRQYENVNIKCDTFLTFFQLIFRISSSNSSPAE